MGEAKIDFLKKSLEINNFLEAHGRDIGDEVKTITENLLAYMFVQERSHKVLEGSKEERVWAQRVPELKDALAKIAKKKRGG